MPAAPLELSRDQIMAFRLRVNGLNERLPMSPESLRSAAWAGLQDSMPRAALVSVHARAERTPPTILDDESLIQVWGPRYSTYVVAKVDLPIFTLGRLPEDAAGRLRAEQAAARLHELLDGTKMGYGAAGSALGVNANSLRYGATTGRIVMRWDGARQPIVWTVPKPEMDPAEARLELARRYLHVFGPATPAAFAEWAGITPRSAYAAFAALGDELTPVRTPLGGGWILARDEPALSDATGPRASARLLPSGDTHFLLQGRDRELLVPDPARRALLWTPRVWPGALLIEGEICGTWRRAHEKVTIEPWRALSPTERAAVESEAESLPLPGVESRIVVRWA